MDRENITSREEKTTARMKPARFIVGTGILLLYIIKTISWWITKSFIIPLFRGIITIMFNPHALMRSSSNHLSRGGRKVVGIDVGIVNLGMCKWEEGKQEPEHLSRSSLLLNKNGRVYTYKEQIAEELVENWLNDHWEEVFRGTSLVLIEKQMTSQNSGRLGERDRACIIIESLLKMALRREKGGPEYLVITPMEWKRHNQIGNFGDKNTNAHSKNKMESVREFCRRVSPELVRKCKQVGKMDDMADAYWIAKFGLERFDELLYRAQQKHNHDLNIMDPWQRIQEEERRTEDHWLDFNESQDDEMEICDVISLYNDFKKEEKKLKKSGLTVKQEILRLEREEKKERKIREKEEKENKKKKLNLKDSKFFPRQPGE